MQTYVDRLASALPCARRRRAAICAEVGAGLADAVQARVRSGVPPERAARLAISAFGAPSSVASEFVAELAVRASHRTGVGLLLTGPVVGLAWLVAPPLASGEGAPARVADL